MSKITNAEAAAAAAVLLKFRAQEGTAGAWVPPEVTAALNAIQLPADDLIARGPSSPLTDAQVADTVAKLERADAQLVNGVGFAKKLLGIFGL